MAGRDSCQSRINSPIVRAARISGLVILLLVTAAGQQPSFESLAREYDYDFDKSLSAAV